MESCLVFPSPPTGNHRRVELAGIDLWITPRIDNVFVYPSELDLNRLKEALSRTLSLWSLVAGRFLLIDGERYVIDMSDQGIPFSLVRNTELTRWPLDQNVVLDSAEGRLHMFLDEVSTAQLHRGSTDESLFRVRMTHVVHSGEWVMGISWAHVLGDAFACLKFLNTLSRFYQHLEPAESLPIFERRLWHRGDADASLLHFMRHLTDGLSVEQCSEKSASEQLTHEQINIHFSGEHLTQLHKLARNETFTVQDALTAYIILTLNTHCYDNDKQLIRHTNMIVNYRGVSDSIASPGLMANCTLRMLSENFQDPYSMSSIARAIRLSVSGSRDPVFLQSILSTADGLMRDLAHDGREVNVDPFPHGIIVNSNYRYDWANLVDLGYADKCRFYTDGTAPLFLRVFRLNPVFDGNHWLARDRQGAEVAFRLEKTVKQKFIDVWQSDIQNNFAQVKQ